MGHLAWTIIHNWSHQDLNPYLLCLNKLTQGTPESFELSHIALIGTNKFLLTRPLLFSRKLCIRDDPYWYMYYNLCLQVLVQNHGPNHKIHPMYTRRQTPRHILIGFFEHQAWSLRSQKRLWEEKFSLRPIGGFQEYKDNEL